MSRAILGWLALMFVGAVYPQSPSEQSSNPAPAVVSQPRALLDRYCVVCHNQKLKTAGLLLDQMDVSNVSEAAPNWEKVVRKLRTGAMPPGGLPRPDKTGYDTLATYLETSLDRAALAKPNPGTPTIHRLNRTEYTNAIHDLLALDIDGEALLPADDSGYGFDNIGDVLSVSPSQLDRYIGAAREISRRAIGDPTIRMPVSTYDVSSSSFQNDQASDDLSFGSRGGIVIHHYFPLDGEYLVKIRLQGLDAAAMNALREPHQLEVRLDGAIIQRFTFGGRSGTAGSEGRLKSEKANSNLEVRFPVKAGTRLVGVAFRDERSLSEGMVRPTLVQLQIDGLGPRADSEADPGVDNVSIAGPYEARGAGETPSRRKIFVCHPNGAKDEDLCAKKILTTLSRRAYRRPVTDADVQKLYALYQTGRGAGFEAGIGRALQGMLLSREFLFRMERDPANVAAGTPHRISDLELASRLSFFLWSTMPDDPLLALAEQGKLKDPEVLGQQVRRMLADPRSKALVENFASQWLDLREMRSVVPDAGNFPNFDEDLRQAFETEAELFFESMLREDHSVVDLLNANYTFVNERLARHYGIPDIYGSRFRRITLTDENRWGLLGKGAILTVTSYPNRTSPVLRGKWVLENILGAAPPPPPPNVPALQESVGPQRRTLRAQMEQHRANPACASCHKLTDPIGFALENFDAVGTWRTTEANTPLDVSGILLDGTKFQGPAELRKILAGHPEQFLSNFTEKLLTYALGRGVEYYDEPAVREILRQAAPNDNRWSAFILAIAESEPFQMRRTADRTSVASLR